MSQTTDTVLMIRPINFRMNEQTAVNNYYQKEIDKLTQENINQKAQKEFDVFVNKLREKGIQVILIEDTREHDTPDSVFPNNWISFHAEGIVGLYPMFAENRRLERREDVLLELEEKGFKINQIYDYRNAEIDGLFLEGTGSLALDRINKKAYCALSPRADEELVIEFCEDFEYTPVLFTANQTVNGTRKPIYHTNVMMCLGTKFAIVCLDSIDDKKERKNVVDHLLKDGKEIISITEKQVNSFAGNMLELKNHSDDIFIIMSQSAYESLTEDQIKKLKNYGEILSSDITTIETCGGGSARCMIAEVFLPVA